MNTRIAAVTLVILGAGTAGCGACLAERAVVDALDVGLDAAVVSVAGVNLDEDQVEQLGRVAAVAGGAVALGDAAVRACVALRDGAGWRVWVRLALEAFAGVLAVLKGVDVGMPALLVSGVEAAQGLLPSLGE